MNICKTTFVEPRHDSTFCRFDTGGADMLDSLLPAVIRSADHLRVAGEKLAALLDQIDQAGSDMAPGHGHFQNAIDRWNSAHQEIVNVLAKMENRTRDLGPSRPLQNTGNKRGADSKLGHLSASGASVRD